jgi:hypothetical protein
MGIPVPTQKEIGPWTIYILALVVVTMFGFWRAEIENVRKANLEVAEVQKKVRRGKDSGGKNNRSSGLTLCTMK